MSAVYNGSQHHHQQCSNRNEVARRRWKILARALQKSTDVDTTPSDVDDIISVRRFTTFDLVTSRPIELGSSSSDPSASWYEYTTTILQEKYSLNIRHPTRNFTAAELMGFNNTGNICVWPSEEVLAYYILCNLEYFSGKTVLELGGGMTCLAGLMVAKYTMATGIHVTDGNISAVDNVEYILKQNDFGDTKRVTCSVLQWGDFQGNMNGKHITTYDIILSADCLFFDDARLDLVETIWATLTECGVAMVMAPRRGQTYDKFVEEAKMRGFHCQSKHYYNEHVWNRHLKLKQSCDYDENIHYPMLLLLSKNYVENSHNDI
ncbi:Calmodulin-lysine N-methyltransferase [Blattella germanica]|nr:Calmodulin-lysine N-methyltransferase [Blattella germanica]